MIENIENKAKKRKKIPPTLWVLPILFLGILGFITWETTAVNWTNYGKAVYNIWLTADAEIKELSLVEKLDTTFTAIESTAGDSLWNKEGFIALDGLIQKYLDHHFIRDAEYSYSVIKDNNDILQFYTYSLEPDEIFQRLDEFTALGIPMLYIQAPTKYIEGYTELPATFSDNTSSNIAKNIALCEAAGVAYLNLRENASEAESEGILDFSTMFFVTDHHWTPETAFWALDETIDEIGEVFGIDYDPNNYYTDFENWTTTTYEASFLGSQGKRVEQYYAGLDDFTLMLPDFATDFDVTLVLSSGEVEEYSGSFYESIIDEDMLDMTASLETNRYAAYWGGDYPKVSVNNNLIDDGSTILILKDSYALPFSAFFATMVDQVYMIDLRYFSIDLLEEYIADIDPDLILMLYS